MLYQKDSKIVFNKTKSIFEFVDENKKYSENDDEKVSFQVGDTVEFKDFPNISSKTLTGVIKKLGWSVGPGGPYITCGIKVENAKFGKALLYNYTISPNFLAKV
jgi:hypothetical protein